MLAFLGNLCYTKQVPNARVQKKHKKLIWLRGQAVKTLASHAGIRGSIPLGVTGIHRINLWIFFVVSVMKRSLRSIHLGRIFYKSISPENGNDLFEI